MSICAGCQHTAMSVGPFSPMLKCDAQAGLSLNPTGQAPSRRGFPGKMLLSVQFPDQQLVNLGRIGFAPGCFHDLADEVAQHFGPPVLWRRPVVFHLLC